MKTACKTLSCVVCGAPVNVEAKSKVGQLIDCSVCGIELEILELDPPRLEVFEEEEK